MSFFLRQIDMTVRGRLERFFHPSRLVEILGFYQFPFLKIHMRRFGMITRRCEIGISKPHYSSAIL